MTEVKRPLRYSGDLEDVRALRNTFAETRDRDDGEALLTALDSFLAANPPVEAAPEPVTADPSAPLDVQALPAFWHARRAAAGKDPSRCAMELERALAAEPRAVVADTDSKSATDELVDQVLAMNFAGDAKSTAFRAAYIRACAIAMAIREGLVSR